MMIRVLGKETGRVYGLFNNEPEAFRWMQKKFPSYKKEKSDGGRLNIKEPIYSEPLLITRHLEETR